MVYAMMKLNLTVTMSNLSLLLYYFLNTSLKSMRRFVLKDSGLEKLSDHHRRLSDTSRLSDTLSDRIISDTSRIIETSAINAHPNVSAKRHQ